MTARSVREEVIDCLPHLRAFARSLTGKRERADDLVQDAVVRALTAADQFTPGTNFKAWIFTILRNLYFNELRKNRYPIEPLEAADIESRATAPTQDAGLIFDEFRTSFMTLSAEQREALVLVGASGFSYEEAAKVCNCAVGTIKSRISRARRELLRRTAEEGDAPGGPTKPARADPADTVAAGGVKG